MLHQLRHHRNLHHNVYPIGKIRKGPALGKEDQEREGGRKRAVADGINFAWALLPSAGQREVIDRAALNWQNTLAGRPELFSSTWIPPQHMGSTPTPPSPIWSLRIPG